MGWDGSHGTAVAIARHNARHNRTADRERKEPRATDVARKREEVECQGIDPNGYMNSLMIRYKR